MSILTPWVIDTVLRKVGSVWLMGSTISRIYSKSKGLCTSIFFRPDPEIGLELCARCGIPGHPSGLFYDSIRDDFL